MLPETLCLQALLPFLAEAQEQPPMPEARDREGSDQLLPFLCEQPPTILTVMVIFPSSVLFS
jgi:hypothetical protein